MKFKTNIKFASKYITILLVISLLFQAFSAVALQKPSTNLPQPLGIGSPVKKTSGKGSAGALQGKEFVFSSSLNGSTQNFYLSFPAFGGIRLTTNSITSSNSIFEPNNYYGISSTVSNNGTILTAGSMTVNYTTTNSSWSLSFKKYNGDTFVLSSEDLIFYKKNRLYL